MRIQFQEGVNFRETTYREAQTLIRNLPPSHPCGAPGGWDGSWYNELYVWNDWHTSEDPREHLTIILFSAKDWKSPRTGRRVFHMFRNGTIEAQGFNAASTMMQHTAPEYTNWGRGPRSARR